MSVCVLISTGKCVFKQSIINKNIYKKKNVCGKYSTRARGVCSSLSADETSQAPTLYPRVTVLGATPCTPRGFVDDSILNLSSF